MSMASSSSSGAATAAVRAVRNLAATLPRQMLLHGTTDTRCQAVDHRTMPDSCHATRSSAFASPALISQRCTDRDEIAFTLHRASALPCAA